MTDDKLLSLGEIFGFRPPDLSPKVTKTRFSVVIQTYQRQPLVSECVKVQARHNTN